MLLKGLFGDPLPEINARRCPVKGKGLSWLCLAVLFAVSLAVSGTSVAAGPQDNAVPFDQLMALASVKKLLVVDTVAGKTKVLFTSSVEKPDLIVIHAAGGDGNPTFIRKQDGLPYSKKAGNPMFLFGVAFLKKNVAWAAIDVPADFGDSLSTSARVESKHVEAVAQAAGQLRQLYPTAKLILVGHSNGGVTAGMQAVRPQSPFDGIVFASPNLPKLPFDLEPKRVKVPIMFITHSHDNCPSTYAAQTIGAAGSQFPVVLIEAPSAGPSGECRKSPAPHFFSNVQDEMAEAVIQWSRKL